MVAAEHKVLVTLKYSALTSNGKGTINSLVDNNLLKAKLQPAEKSPRACANKQTNKTNGIRNWELGVGIRRKLEADGTPDIDQMMADFIQGLQ